MIIIQTNLPPTFWLCIHTETISCTCEFSMWRKNGLRKGLMNNQQGSEWIVKFNWAVFIGVNVEADNTVRTLWNGPQSDLWWRTGFINMYSQIPNDRNSWLYEIFFEDKETGEWGNKYHSVAHLERIVFVIHSIGFKFAWSWCYLNLPERMKSVRQETLLQICEKSTSNNISLQKFSVSYFIK